MNLNVLKDLKDIHLPPSPSLWPWAPGWYLLSALLIGLTFYFYLRLKQTEHRRKAKKAALKIINSLARHPDQAETMIELSKLLRRVALVAFPRQEVAALHGHNWLLFLDRTGNTNSFSEGVGQVFLSAPYCPAKVPDIETIISISRRWIKRVL